MERKTHMTVAGREFRLATDGEDLKRDKYKEALVIIEHIESGKLDVQIINRACDAFARLNKNELLCVDHREMVTDKQPIQRQFNLYFFTGQLSAARKMDQWQVLAELAPRLAGKQIRPTRMSSVKLKTRN